MFAYNLNYILLFCYIVSSLEANLNNKNKYTIKKGTFLNSLSKKEENNKSNQYDEQKILSEIDSLVNNITTKYENELLNLTLKINNIINTSLDTQNEIINRAESEKIMINRMLNDIKLLKEKYKQNMNHTYIMGGIIIIVFLLFCIIDFLKKDNRPTIAPSGYNKAIEEQNSNNQISIV